MKLYYFDGSTTCRPIVMFAAEAGLPLDLEVVNVFAGEHKSDRYTAVNPNQLIPVLEEPDGFRLMESSAILKYLADKAGHRAWPTDARARAAVNSRMDWFNTGFYRDFGYGYVYGQLFPQAKWEDEGMQAAAIARARTASERHFAVLERHMLREDAPFLGGGEPDLSDYLGAAYVTIGELVGWDYTPYPRIRRWIAAMRARPGWGGANGGFNGWRDSLGGKAAA